MVFVCQPERWWIEAGFNLIQSQVCVTVFGMFPAFYPFVKSSEKRGVSPDI